MNAPSKKKYIILIVKILIGILSFWFIYHRFAATPNFGVQLATIFSEQSMLLVAILTLLLMPVNWGIESYKWKLITSPVEVISFKTSVKSVFSGICIGNIAPGRALEFAAKIVFFKPENRPTITIIHFINGMFQMFITVSVGMVAIFYKSFYSSENSNITYLIITFGILLILGFFWSILNVEVIQKKLSFLKWFKNIQEEQIIRLPINLIITLFGYSIIRYLVFTFQFYFIYHSLAQNSEFFDVFMSISAYFMLTSAIPMISYIEPAIRAAIALFVFNGINNNEIVVILSSTIIWIINVVIPSLIGYIIILKEKISIK
jgi:hypothetical protein